MATKRDFTVINGGTGGRTQKASVDTGLINERGYRVVRDRQPTDGGDDDGGGSVNTRLASLESHRNWLWGVLGTAIVVAVSAIAGSFVILDDRIQGRFDRADEKVAEINTGVSDLRVEIATQGGDIKAILEKIDDNPPSGNQAK